MSKVSGSYESVVRGVSEQAPQDRRSGQHQEQLNIISDPVRGQVRRHGSILQHEVPLGALDAPTYANLLSNTDNHTVTTFYVDGVPYDLIASRSPADSTSFAWCFNRDTRQFIPVVLGSDSVVTALVNGGMSAAVGVGNFLLIAGNDIVPSYTGTDRWGTAANASKVACWVRGGAYARTFKITVTKTDGTQVSASYKTKTSSYPEELDTSDIPASATDYQKQVNDRVNAYNSAATKWIGDAAEDITPENIAQKLADQLTAAGVTGVSRVDGTVVITNAAISTLTCDDGGDGSLLHGVGQEVTAPELVSTVHWAGKVIKVRPRRSNGDDAFYLEAVPEAGAAATGWTKVYWRECAGYVMQPNVLFAVATVHGGTLYIEGTPAALATTTGLDVPAYKPNPVGDQQTSPLPYLFGKRINYLGTFQDRLVIASDAVVLFSRPGDYFDWFRQSVLTVADDDPVEEYALGSEFDTIVAGADFDRDRILFGKLHWYSLSGRVPLTPKSNSITVLRQEQDTVDAPPVQSNNFVFYTKRLTEAAKETTRLFQVQAGVLADSPEGSDCSTQLDSYIVGTPLQVMPLTAPNTVVIRTANERRTLYLYAYLDNQQNGQRLFDSWGKWSWSGQVGELLAISADKSGFFAYFIRQAKDATGTTLAWVACERFTMATSLSPYPHLDSLRTYDDYVASGRDFGDEGYVAFDKSSPQYMLGYSLQSASGLSSDGLWCGVGFDASFTPTNPYMRDRNGQAILSGRLTLGRVLVTLSNSGGCVVTVNYRGNAITSLDFNGRVIGDPNNQIGKQPIVTTQVSAGVGKEVRDCSYTIAAKQWLPLVVTSIEWSGQFFNNQKRN